MRIKCVVLGQLILLSFCQMPATDAMVHADQLPSGKSSQLRSRSSDRNMRQSTLDPTGFDSGFWRSEYLVSPAEQQNSESAHLDPGTEKVQSEVPQAGTSAGPDTQQVVARSLLYSENLAMAPSKTPVIIETPDTQVTAGLGLSEASKLTDWEYAVLESSGNTTPWTTATGPSATSAILAIVGVVIVVGAYASSGKRES